MNPNSTNQIYTTFNAIGVAIAYGMLSLSVWLAPVDLSTKGYWGMGVFLLTISLVNVVKYRQDDRTTQDRLNRLETAKNERILEDYIVEKEQA